jgi:hypothetical protein
VFVRDSETVDNQILDRLDRDRTHAFQRHLNRARTSSIGKLSPRLTNEFDAAVEIAGDTLSELGYL